MSEKEFTLKEALGLMNENSIEPQWCAGCGDFGELNVIKQTIAGLIVNKKIKDLAPHALVVVGGIGCAGQTPQYLNGYSLKVPHGRALPAALGVKLARIDLTVVAQGGDGDAWAIGMGHFANFAGWNADITYIVTNNEVYGLTKGQTAPTASTTLKTGVSPWGPRKDPVNPIAIAISSGWTYVARAASVGKTKEGFDTRVFCQEVLEKAILHKGASLVIFETECPTYNKVKTAEWLRERVAPIREDHDVKDEIAAIKLSLTAADEKIPIGIYYEVEKPTMHERLGVTEPLLSRDYPKEKLEHMMDEFV